MDVLFPVRSIRQMFSKCNNVMNYGGHSNNTDATLFGSEILMTGKHWSDKQIFEIWYTKFTVCQTEAPLLFVSWTEMVSISPSRSLRPRLFSGD